MDDKRFIAEPQSTSRRLHRSACWPPCRPHFAAASDCDHIRNVDSSWLAFRSGAIVASQRRISAYSVLCGSLRPGQGGAPQRRVQVGKCHARVLSERVQYPHKDASSRWGKRASSCCELRGWSTYYASIFARFINVVDDISALTNGGRQCQP